MRHLLTQAQNLIERYSVESKQHITIKDNSFVINDSRNTTYEPSKTGNLFHDSDSRVRLISGPIRSGKSVASCCDIILKACRMPPCVNGVRRSRCVIVRNTYPDLKSTVVKTWEQWFSELGQFRTNYQSPITFKHFFRDQDGEVELEVWFLALDSYKDIRKILSLETTWMYINESREIMQILFTNIMGRLGQYPMKEECLLPFNYGITMDTNPPSTDHWLYKTFEVDRPDNYELFKQPPALLKDEHGKWINNPEADNTSNLPANFYIDLAYNNSHDEDYIKVYILGEYGTIKAGKMVYQNYNDSIHSKENLTLTEHPIYIGWDPGLICPAAIIAQYDGVQLRIIKEFVGDTIYFDEFIGIVSNWMNQYLKNHKISHVVDPSINMQFLKFMYDKGIMAKKANSNKIEERIVAVDSFLTKITGGQPAIMIDQNTCAVLRKGFIEKYAYIKKNILTENPLDSHRDEPDKAHPYSDVQDCLQYICLEFFHQAPKTGGSLFKMAFTKH